MRNRKERETIKIALGRLIALNRSECVGCFARRNILITARQICADDDRECKSLVANEFAATFDLFTSDRLRRA